MCISMQATILVVILLLIPSTAPASNAESDRLSLLSFKSHVKDDPTGALASWNQTVHHCQWTGVTCGGERHPDRVVGLQLQTLGLAGAVPSAVANLTFLRVLNLSRNNLRGGVPEELGRLSRVQYIGLHHNSLGGKIPSSLGNCPRLRYLRLFNNHLVGSIPTSLGNCSRLKKLMLTSNLLEGEIPSSLGNISSLTQLYLDSNSLHGTVPSSLGNLKNLTELYVGFNELVGTIPASLYNLTGMQVFGVFETQIRGTLSRDIGLLFPNLQRIDLNGNQFRGLIPYSLCNASSLSFVQLGSNQFSGVVPECLGALQDMQVFSIFGNQLEAKGPNDWTFLTSLTNCTTLFALQLEDNRFGGVLPHTLSNLSTHLSILTLGGSGISGTIPEGIGNLNSLNYFDIKDSYLGGRIPESVGMLQQLQHLDLSRNKIVGQLPSSICNLTKMVDLYLGGNGLQGSIPVCIIRMKGLASFNLSNNNFNDAIPKELVKLDSLTRYLDLSYNNFSGSLPSEIGHLTNLVAINVSSNRLSGAIPTNLGDCLMLVVLLMQDNLFQGEIPESLAKLRSIETLDFSRNRLSGTIPMSLQDLRFLKHLNLSYNDLEGEVPKNGIFQNASKFMVLGNGKLCGGILQLELPPCTNSSETERRQRRKLKIVIVTVSATFALVVLLSFLAFLYRKRKVSRGTSSTNDYALRNSHARVSYAELAKATNGFSSTNWIGAGSFGSVYTGYVESIATQVAVKVFKLQQRGALKSFLAECETLKTIRHRNLVKILTSCSSTDFQGNNFKALVYQYLPNGSLDKWLHSESNIDDASRKLSLIERLNIAIDVAVALDYLHDHGEKPIVHCDLKPSNVLLDNDMTAYVGDFGLAKILLTDQNESSQSLSSSLAIKGTVGYVAPEYGMGSTVSPQGDVFSYGILLLEMITGKRPTDDSFGEGSNLHKFVESAIPGQIWDVIDTTLMWEDNIKEAAGDMNRGVNMMVKMEECLVTMGRCGLLCSEESPIDRMSLKVSLKELTAARDRFLQNVV